MKPAAPVAGLILYALAAATAAHGQDVLTIGNAFANPGARVAVPVYVRDVKGTALGVDKPNDIRNIVFTVQFSAPAKISGCSEPQVPQCSVSFRPTTLLAGATTSTSLGSSSIEVRIMVNPSDPVEFTLDKALPGDYIGDLMVNVDEDATAGTIAFTVDPGPEATFFGGPIGQNMKESVNDGLTVVSGSLTICIPVQPSGLQISYASDSCSSDFGGTCQKGTRIDFHVTATGYKIQSCDQVTWNFGDGGGGSGIAVPHIYQTSSSATSFTVTATLTNSAGNTTATTVLQMSVPIVVCECDTFGPGSLVVGGSGTFTATSTCQASSYQWKFGNTSAVETTTVPTITHSFATIGTFGWAVTVTPVVSGPQPCTASDNVVIVETGGRRRSVGKP